MAGVDQSPFLDVPTADHVASNRSAFAIRDAFPVTAGHTLVIPRRLITTWWEASTDERGDLIALVDEVKELLDNDYAPHGYNVGFNAGAAAGQTVDHLHLHVIPRTHGDVDDPRGGIRHVIPGLGNYLKRSDVPSTTPEAALIDGLELELLPFLREAIADARYDRMEIVVSFIKRSGIELLLPDLRDAVHGDRTLRLLTTDYLGITEPAALAQLHDLAQDYPSKVELRVHRATSQSFHPKAYIFSSATDPAAARSYVGSSNLTRSGLQGGIEWNVGIDAVAHTRRAFQVLWEDPRSQPLTRPLLDHLASQPRPQPMTWGSGDPVALEAPIDAVDEVEEVTPHDIQVEALNALAQTRAEGQTAGLVVMATGLGKTYLAAFDVLAAGAGRVLFVAHREEILQQARDSFRRVIPAASMGLFIGSERQTETRFVFASVQSLVNHLDRFDPDEFDYIVVDEFHHAAATSYRTVIDHFRPDFLLGLTATPERMDGASILTLCHDNQVYSCDLVEGIKAGRLTSFHYHGLADPTDYTAIPWRSGRFDPDDLDAALATDARAGAVFDGWEARRGSRTLAFCISMKHADFMADWFSSRGVRAVAVHSGPSSAPRAASVRDLAAGDLEVLFAVDVFNEGLDVPSIDTVLMLRPTMSPVIFVQQLGRGLRVDIGKPTVTVIDMIGNHESFLLRPRTLLSMSIGRVPTNRELIQAMATGAFELPAGCDVNFELTMVDLLGELIARKVPASDLLVEYVRTHLAEEGYRPTKTQAFRAGLNPDRSAIKQPWFSFLAEHQALEEDEADAVLDLRELLARVESSLSNATKSYKMVLLRALLALGALRTSVSVAELTRRSKQIIVGDPRLVTDVTSSTFSEPAQATHAAWEQLWRKNPIRALTTPTGSTPALLRLDGDAISPNFELREEHGAVFDALVAELVDYRLAKYLADRPVNAAAGADRYVLKVSHSGGNPIVRFDRGKAPLLPQRSNVPLVLDGDAYEGDFVKIALNVIRKRGESTNAMSDVMRGWFGPSAGQPGTSHRVVAEDKGTYWTLAPETVDHADVDLPLQPTIAAVGQAEPTAWLSLRVDGASRARHELVYADRDDEAGRWQRGDLVQFDVAGSSPVFVRRLLPAEFNSMEHRVGTWFRRDAVPGLFDEEFNPGNWNSGHVTLDQDTVLFVTMKGGEYLNALLSPTQLRWFSQNSTTPTSKKGAEIIEAPTTGRRLHAFLRPGKGEFVYAGLVTPLRHRRQKPIEFTLRLQTALPSSLLKDLGDLAIEGPAPS